MIRLLNLPGGKSGVMVLEVTDWRRSRLIIPVVFGEQGLQYRCVGPGGDLERLPADIPWIVIIDDHAPGASGPSSFHPTTLRWLLADAYQVTVDAAEPHMELYMHSGEGEVTAKRILLVQTVENRRTVWREFSRKHSELRGILELVPVLDNPKQNVLAVETSFYRGLLPRKVRPPWSSTGTATR
jgi:hypothetical protein